MTSLLEIAPVALEKIIKNRQRISRCHWYIILYLLMKSTVILLKKRTLIYSKHGCFVVGLVETNSKVLEKSILSIVQKHDPSFKQTWISCNKKNALCHFWLKLPECFLKRWKVNILQQQRRRQRQKWQYFLTLKLI